MEYLSAFILGIVQGLTEFLPVSSSGHLAILQYFFGVEENALTFDIFLHLATLVAVIICFRKDIWALIRHPLQRFTLLIIVACIPAGLAGVFFNDFVAGLFHSVWVPTLALLITAAILFISDRLRGHKAVQEITIPMALLIGVFQMVALVPGISRSGSTIFAALLVGLARSEAAKFSFILSIPVILGAFLLDTVDVVQETGGFPFDLTFAIGGLAAIIAGIFAIKLVINLLNRGRFVYFSIYCVCLSILVMLLLLLGL